MLTKIARSLLACSAILYMIDSHAQEPSLDLLSDGLMIIGIANQSDGSPATDLTLTLQNVTNNQSAATTITTDSAGVFVHIGEEFTEYRANAEVEGRTVTATVKTGAAPDAPFQWPPIYITLGALMLLSLIPARMLRRKDL